MASYLVICSHSSCELYFCSSVTSVGEMNRDALLPCRVFLVILWRETFSASQSSISYKREKSLEFFFQPADQQRTATGEGGAVIHYSKLYTTRENYHSCTFSRTMSCKLLCIFESVTLKLFHVLLIPVTHFVPGPTKPPCRRNCHEVIRNMLLFLAEFHLFWTYQSVRSLWQPSINPLLKHNFKTCLLWSQHLFSSSFVQFRVGGSSCLKRKASITEPHPLIIEF